MFPTEYCNNNNIVVHLYHITRVFVVHAHEVHSATLTNDHVNIEQAILHNKLHSLGRHSMSTRRIPPNECILYNIAYGKRAT